MDIGVYMRQLGEQARLASSEIAKATTAQKNGALLAIADSIDSQRQKLVLPQKSDKCRLGPCGIVLAPGRVEHGNLTKPRLS